MGQQPGKVAPALGVLEAHDRALVADRPVLTLPAEHVAGGLGGQARCPGQAIFHCAAVTIRRHQPGKPRHGPRGPGRAAAVGGRRGLVHHQPPDQRAIYREDPTWPSAEHQHHTAGPVDQRFKFPASPSAADGARPPPPRARSSKRTTTTCAVSRAATTGSPGPCRNAPPTKMTTGLSSDRPRTITMPLLEAPASIRSAPFRLRRHVLPAARRPTSGSGPTPPRWASRAAYPLG
jgi:hypothetical protein